MAHTILVIDGESMQRDLLCSMLKERLAYCVASVASGHEAVHYVMSEKTPKPDVILFDVSTVKDGYEIIAHLILLSHTPIIALVKYGDYEVALATLGAGAQDFLSKPVALERMSTTLRNTLLLRDARREAEWLRRERINAGANGASGMMPFPLIAEDGNIRRIAHLEADAIRFAMQYYNGRMTEVARRLGIGRSTLYRKLNDLSIRHTEAA